MVQTAGTSVHHGSSGQLEQAHHLMKPPRKNTTSPYIVYYCYFIVSTTAVHETSPIELGPKERHLFTNTEKLRAPIVPISICYSRYMATTTLPTGIFCLMFKVSDPASWPDQDSNSKNNYHTFFSQFEFS